MRVENLRGTARVLKKRSNFMVFNSLTGLAGGLMTNIGGSLGNSTVDTPTTDIPAVSAQGRGYREPGVSSRSNIGTSKPGGIGGF
jgi:hypothetical protein